MTEASGIHIADSHEMIRVVGARENNLKNVSVDIPKRRLTVFTGVSGSGKSSLVFATIANESQRLINETYPTFVQQFMGQLNRPEVDALENVSPAIIVDQERMGANSRSTVGTATDAQAMLRILFSRLGQPHVGSPQAFSFNIPSVSGAGAVTFEKGGKKVKERRSFEITGGMCPRCEGLGEASDVDLDELFDSSKSLADGALTIPGYNVDGWMVRGFTESGFMDPNKPIEDYTEQERAGLPLQGADEGQDPGDQHDLRGAHPEDHEVASCRRTATRLQPHIRAFVDRAVKFTACPDCGGTRLNEGARSSKIKGVNIADAAAMQITDLADWLATVDDPEVAPLMQGLRATIDSFVDIGLGYLSLDRSSGTLSGGEAQRTKMIRHLGLRADRHQLRLRRADRGASSARHPAHERAAQAPARQGQHGAGRRAQARGHRDRRPHRRPRARRRPRGRRDPVHREMSQGSAPPTRSRVATSTIARGSRSRRARRRGRWRSAGRPSTTSRTSTSTSRSASSRS